MRHRARRQARLAGLAHPVDLVDLAPEVHHLEAEDHVRLKKVIMPFLMNVIAALPLLVMVTVSVSPAPLL